MKRDFMLININEWIENQHLFENMISTGAQVWFIMIIAGVTAITNLRKASVSCSISSGRT